ncbi:hypothetical protein ACLB2K_048623 [Fragaria x ananassa]
MYKNLVHRSPAVARICGQNNHGTQSVVLSGGYEDNEDHGEWFIYTGWNESLRISCWMGYPVRVLRTHKDERSSYAPRVKGVRYDGRWGFKVCRYLFVRCDNEPAPWTCDVHGDHPRPLPAIKELKNATDITERKESPSWDYDEDKECWIWKKPPPPSKIRAKKQACEEKLTRKRKTSNKAENVVDDGAVRNKKGKMAAAAAV